MANGTDSPKCAVPECSSIATGRGLCAKHYYRATKGKGPGADEARRHMGRSKREPKGPAGQPRLPRPPKETAPQNGEIVATVTEFATALGIERMPYDGGFIFRNGEHLVHLSTQGDLRVALITLSDFIHHRMGRS